MDRCKLDNQMDRRIEKLALSMAASSGRKPIEEYDRYFFLAEIPFEDSIVQAKVILCTEKLNGTYKGVFLDTKGPWVLFKIEDIVSGDLQANLCPGASVLAKWDNRLKVYTKFIYKEDPKEVDSEVEAISSLVSATPYEIVTGKTEN